MSQKCRGNVIVTQQRRPGWPNPAQVVLGIVTGPEVQAVTQTGRAAANLPHPVGVRPSRLAMILSTRRLGNIAVIKCRIGSGVSW
jgi:hypothetical protein